MSEVGYMARQKNVAHPCAKGKGLERIC